MSDADLLAAAGLTVPTDVYQGLVARGIPAPAALGAAAGVAAEANGGDHTAINPKSGAAGLGQWLGDRQQRLFSAYGGKLPGRDQQIDYLAWEMKGGDPGMASVVSAKDPVTAAQLYIQKGMRPGPGASGDLKRAYQALLSVGVDPDAALHGAAPGRFKPGTQPQAEGGDPIEAALEGKPQAQPGTAPAVAADKSDPIEAALSGEAPQGTPDLQAVNAELRRMFHSGASTDELIAYGAQHGVRPNADQINHAREKGMDVMFVQPDPSAPPPDPQTDQGLGFFEGIKKPLDNAALWLEHGAAKIGLDKPLNAIGSALGLDPSAEAAMAKDKGIIQQAAAEGRVPGGLGEFAGEVAGTLPVALATKNPFIAGGLSGALTTDNPNDLKQTALDAGIGAVGGKVADAVTGAAAGIVAPKIKATVQALHNLGVELTPGQIMGGALRRLEDAATSIPLLGDVVKNAQRRSVFSLNSSVINDRVLAPIGKSLPKGATGREAVDYADQQVSNAYNDLLPKLSVQADQQFIQNAGQILQRANELPADRAEQVRNIIKNNLVGRFNEAGQMDGSTFQKGDERLGEIARKYAGSSVADEREMAGIVRDIQGEFRDLLERSNPQYVGQLQPIRQAFANLVRVEGAAGSAGAKGGTFTGNQLAAAVKRYDTSPRKKAYATGKALLQDISDPASEVLPPSLPDSGSAFRMFAAYLLGGGLGHISPMAAPAAAPFALYTKTGQKAFQRIMLAPRTPAEKALARALTQLKAPLAVAGGAAGAEAANGY